MTAVIIILYNRPIHTLRLFESIIKAKNYNKFNFKIFCDGPKNLSDQNKIKKIKKIIHQFKNQINLNLCFRKKNLGLKKNIIMSLNYVFKSHDKAIILEDDLVLNKNFFIFMSKALQKYKNSKKIFQISGYSYPIKNTKYHYFLSLTSCWGWGITSQNWKDFSNFYSNENMLLSSYKKIKQSKKLKSNFNYKNTYNYFSMLENNFKNKINSWGIVFYLYLFLNQKLTLFPNASLIKNNGFDGTGNHKSKNNLFNSDVKNINLDNFPNKIVESSIHRLKVENFFKKNLSLYAKIKKIIYEKIT